MSSREVNDDINILGKYKNQRVNIVFNNFQPAVNLNNFQNNFRYIANSILTTSAVIDYFEPSDINKIIYTSSSSVYGNNILCKETDELKPMNLHASLKVANEKLIEKYCLDNDVEYTIARIFNMYGGDDRFSVVSKIVNAYKDNKELTVVNNGNAIRDFIHISDVVDIYKKLLNINNIKILNVGTGFGSSVKGILDFLLHNGIHIGVKNIFREELKISTADTTQLFRVLHKEKFIKIEDYLQKIFCL